MTLSPTARKWVRAVVDFGGLAAFLVAFFYLKSTGMPQQQALVQATWALVAGSAVGLAIGFIVERRIAPFPLIGGVAALFFGGLTLFFHDPRLLKIKPTVMNTAFGVILLGGLAMRKNPLKLLMGEAMQMPDEGWRKLTLRWGLFFFVLAALNEVVWRTQTQDFWVAFKVWGVMPLTMAFALAQTPLILKHEIKPAKTEE